MGRILQEGKSYTFRSYFELPYDTDEVLAEFGYRFTRARLDLPRSQQVIPHLALLSQYFEETTPYVALSSETAKREIFVAPVLSRIAVACKQTLRIEYPIKINEQLQGNLDYLLQAADAFVVIEAKRDDLTRGFTQLAVEMIALSMREDAPAHIYGAVTMGTLWVFGRLDAEQRLITQDIGSFKLPDDLEALMAVLLGILA